MLFGSIRDVCILLWSQNELFAVSLAKSMTTFIRIHHSPGVNAPQKVSHRNISAHKILEPIHFTADCIVP